MRPSDAIDADSYIPLHTLQVLVRPSVEIDADGLELLQAAAPMLRDGAAAIENASIGDDHPLPLRSMAAFDKAFAAARRDVVADLREAVCCALNEIDAHAVTAELRTYPKPSKMIQKVRGVSRLA